MLRLMEIRPMAGHVYMVALERNGRTSYYEFTYIPPSKPDSLPHMDYPDRFEWDLYEYAEPPPPPGLPYGAPIIPPVHDILDRVAKVMKGKTVDLPTVIDERSFPPRKSVLGVPPAQPEPSGAVAGLAWPMIDQVVDPAVPAQLDSAAAGPACAYMVLRDRGFEVPSAELVLRARARVHPELTSRFVDGETLLRLVQAVDPGGGWVGSQLSAACVRDRPREPLLEELGEQGPWIAQVRRHFVVVDRFDSQTGQLSIRDPWHQPGRARGTDAGTRYRVSLPTFFEAWSAVAIYREEPC